MSEKKTYKLKELLPLIKGSSYSAMDEAGSNIILRPECEEWTWVKFNMNSGLLGLLGDLEVEAIEADDDDVVLWIKTKSFNCFV